VQQQIGPPVGIDLDPPTPRSRWRPKAAIVGSISLHVVAPLGVVVVPEAWPWAFGAIAANHLLLGIAGMCPRSTILGPNLTRLPEAAAGRREVALTFDDGPDPEVTPKVLDLLDARGVRATFFCIADLAARHPDLCRQIASRGHAIENHSRRHLRTFRAARHERASCGDRARAVDPRRACGSSSAVLPSSRRIAQPAARSGAARNESAASQAGPGADSIRAEAMQAKWQRDCSTAWLPETSSCCTMDTRREPHPARRSSSTSCRACSIASNRSDFDPSRSARQRIRERRILSNARAKMRRRAINRPGALRTTLRSASSQGDPAFAHILARGLIPDRSRILDLGCGQGLMAALLQTARDRCGNWPAGMSLPPDPVAYCGIDVERRSIERAKHAVDGTAVPRTSYAPTSAAFRSTRLTP
jgi:hypothetical protein